MTAEFGPIDDERAHKLTERLTAIPYSWACSVLSTASSDTSLRFNKDRFVLSVHGESEYSGDAYNRGHLVAGVQTLVYMGIFFSGYVLSMVPRMLPYDSGGLSMYAAAFFAMLTLVWLSVCVVFAVGLPSLSKKVRVIDHTTEPLPDELESLQQQFVDGDLDEHELADRVEAVIDR